MIDLRFNYPVLASQHRQLRQGLSALPESDVYLRMEPPEGYDEDKQVAAQWLSRPSYPIDASSVLLGCGGHHGLTVILLAADLAGTTLVVDPLTYNGLLGLASVFNIRLVPCSIDAEGMLPDSLETVCRQTPVKAVYLMPTIHNPLGFVMPLARRKALVEVARKYDLLLIDDDAYGFLEPQAPVSFAHLAPERGFFIHSFAKVIAPGVKTSYLVVPAAWKAKVSTAIRLTSSGSVPLLSRLIGSWIASGLLDQLIGQKRAQAASKQQLLKQVLGKYPYLAHPTSFHGWLPLPDLVDVHAFGNRLLAQGVEVVTSEAYQVSGEQPYKGIRIALGNVAEEATLIEGLALVAHTLQEYGIQGDR